MAGRISGAHVSLIKHLPVRVVCQVPRTPHLTHHSCHQPSRSCTNPTYPYPRRETGHSCYRRVAPMLDYHQDMIHTSLIAPWLPNAPTLSPLAAPSLPKRHIHNGRHAKAAPCREGAHPWYLRRRHSQRQHHCWRCVGADPGTQPRCRCRHEGFCQLPGPSPGH